MLIPHFPSLAVCLLSFFVASAAGALEPLPVVRHQQKIGPGSGAFPGEIRERTSFGWGLAGLGDRDGDGVPKVAIGAHFDSSFAERAGALWITTLDRDGTVREATKVGRRSGGFAGALRPHDGFGLAIAPLGDLDGDGTIEIAVSAPGDGDGGPHAGAVYLLSLDEEDRIVERRKISPRPRWATKFPWTWVLPDWVQGGFSGEIRPGDMFGASLAAVGDVDGDGIGDLAVGTRSTSAEGKMRGSVWLLFLRANGTVKAHTRIGSAAGGFDVVLDEEDAFGLGLAALGDLDGDGVPDLAVGAPGDDDGCDRCGAVYVLFLARDGLVRETAKISATQGGIKGELDDGSEMGIALEALPDLDGNGVLELAVGARGDAEAGDFAGAVWVLSLTREGSVLQHRRITAGRGGLVAELEANDVFGSGLAHLGDLDGDGWPELAAGAEGDDDGGTNAGAVWVLFFGPS